MTTDKDDLEPIEPGTAQKLFLDHKATDCTDSTVQNHRYRLNPFVRWCGEEDIDNLNDITGRDLQRYRLWRKEDGDLNKLSLRMQMSTLRVFLKWAGSVEAVPQNLYDKVMVPRVRPEERQRDETLRRRGRLGHLGLPVEVRVRVEGAHGDGAALADGDSRRIRALARLGGHLPRRELRSTDPPARRGNDPEEREERPAPSRAHARRLRGTRGLHPDSPERRDR